MRIIATGDWHIRSVAPRVRIDDYADTQYKKIRWICNIADEYKANIMVAGDVFDTPRCSFELLNKYVQLFKKTKAKIFAVPGQHDMHQHNPDLSTTVLGLLFYTGVMQNLSLSDRGIGFGDAIENKTRDLAVAHVCVTPGEPPFFLPDAISAEDLMDKCPDTSIFITGDYHIPHVEERPGQLLINVGTIMRNNKALTQFKPRIWFIETTNMSYEEIFIPIKNGVFNQELIELDEIAESREELKEMFRSMSGTDEITVDFIKTVEFLSQQAKLSEREQNILNLIMDEVN